MDNCSTHDLQSAKQHRVGKIEKRFYEVFGGLLLLALSGFCPVSAAFVKFTFELSVQPLPAGSVLEPLFSGITEGSGSYTFESTTPDASPGDFRMGNYENAIEALHLNLGPYGYTMGPGSNVISVRNSFAGRDAYLVQSADMIGPTVPSYVPIFFDFQITDASETAFDSTSLPLMPPDLADFPSSNNWRLQFVAPGDPDNPAVTGTVSSLQFVPIPAAWPLFASALGLMGIGIRRHQAERPTRGST